MKSVRDPKCCNGSTSEPMAEVRSRRKPRMWRFAVARVGVIAGLLVTQMAITSEAFAFRTAADLPNILSATPVRWPGGDFLYVIFNQAPGGLLFEAYAQGVEDALLKWTNPSCASFSARYFGPTGNPAQPNDGVNTIEWVPKGWAARGFDPMAPGQTDVLYEQSLSGEWKIREADIYLNGESNSWALISDASSTKWSVQATILHEGGHAAGLEHPCGLSGDGIAPLCDSSVEFNDVAMNPVYNPTLAGLSNDDQAGICSVYPKGLCGSEVCTESETCTSTGCLLTCGTTPCAEGQVCEGDRCKSAGEFDSGIVAQLGSQCSDSVQCERGLACVSGVCVGGATKVGDPCRTDMDCEQGVCDRFGYCAEPCQSSNDCRGSGASCEQLAEGIGACVTSQGGLGSVCDSADDCIGGECLEEENVVPICTRACNATDAACPGGWSCANVDGQDVCVTRPPTGCSCHVSRPHGCSPLLILTSLLTLSVFIRRRGRK